MSKCTARALALGARPGLSASQRQGVSESSRTCSFLLNFWRRAPDIFCNADRHLAISSLLRALQGISADGTHIKTVNKQIAGQSAEFAADGSKIVNDGSSDYQVTKLDYNATAAANATSYTAANQASLGGKTRAQTGALSNTATVAQTRSAAAEAEAKRQAKAVAFQQQMQSKFGKEVESQLQADDDHGAPAVRASTYNQRQSNGRTGQRRR